MKKGVADIRNRGRPTAHVKNTKRCECANIWKGREKEETKSEGVKREGCQKPKNEQREGTVE